MKDGVLPHAARPAGTVTRTTVPRHGAGAVPRPRSSVRRMSAPAARSTGQRQPRRPADRGRPTRHIDDSNERALLSQELAAVRGVGNARATATASGEFATGGTTLRLASSTREEADACRRDPDPSSPRSTGTGWTTGN